MSEGQGKVVARVRVREGDKRGRKGTECARHLEEFETERSL